MLETDNLPAHRGRLGRDHVATTAGRIQLRFLPSYAPDLNPVEFLWARLERHALTNFCPEDFAEPRHTARGEPKSSPCRGAIIASCRQQAELS